METSSSSHIVFSCSFHNDRPLLMMMYPLFKEETSFTIYMRANPYYLKSVPFSQNKSILFFIQRYCYNRDNKIAIFRLSQIIVSSYCCCYSTKGFFQNRELRLTGFACLTAVSATALTVSATDSVVSAMAAYTYLQSLDLC